MIRVRVALKDACLRELVDGFLFENPAESWSLRVMPDGEATLEGYFSDEAAGVRALGFMEEHIGSLGAEARMEPDDGAWREAYRHHLKVRRFGPLVWVPEWERDTVKLQAREKALYLDSGMAFGTGAHETTQLCARQLVRFFDARPPGEADCRVLDAGCGSGILALSAALLGYAKVEGFDFDPEAVRVSRENARDNGLQGAVRFFEADVENGLHDRTADLLLANIETPVLRAHVKSLLQTLAPEGWLVLSGILEREAGPLIQEFTVAADRRWPGGYAKETEVEGEWICVTVRRGMPD